VQNFTNLHSGLLSTNCLVLQAFKFQTNCCCKHSSFRLFNVVNVWISNCLVLQAFEFQTTWCYKCLSFKLLSVASVWISNYLMFEFWTTWCCKHLSFRLHSVTSVWNSNCLVLLQFVGHENVVDSRAFLPMKFKLPLIVVWC